MTSPPRESDLPRDDQGVLHPARLVLAMAICTFSTEILIMALRPEWARDLSPLQGAAADALMLCLLLTPVLYVTIYRPLRASISRLDRALGRMRLLGEIVEKASEAIVVTDATSTILYVNRRFTEITGYAPADALGRKPSLLRSGIHGQDFYADMWSSLLSRGEWQGEICNRKKNGELYLESLSITRVHSESDRSVHYVAMFTQANHDRLTGLANRHHFMNRLRSALELAGDASGSVAVLFIDLDGFKSVNDSFGHDEGDRLLQSVGRALRHATQAPNKLAARLGGDEFVVLLSGPRAPDEARAVAESIRTSIENIASSKPEWLGISGSIGIATTLTGSCIEPLALVKAADEAMYLAKKGGRNRISVGAPLEDRAAIGVLC